MMVFCRDDDGGESERSMVERYLRTKQEETYSVLQPVPSHSKGDESADIATTTPP